jgi:hypothetical protein
MKRKKIFFFNLSILLKHIEFATDSLLPEQEQEINARLRTDGFILCHRCRGKTQFTALKKLKEHLKTDCPLGPGKKLNILI